MRITLGDVRQAVAGQAIAVKATAIQIAITEAPARVEKAADQTGAPRRDAGERPGYDRTSTDLGVGLLEAAAVAPEPRSGGTRGGVQGAVSADGAGGGLPITGSPAAFIAVGGVTLVIAGAAALAYGARRRRFRS